MDKYWQDFGKKLAEQKTIKAFKDVERRQRKLDSKRGGHRNAIKNRRRWPKGTYNVASILNEFNINFKREKITGLPGGSFKQVDFSISKLKLFIEVDGPEHREYIDKLREQQILSLLFYKDWRFYRIKSEVAADLSQCYVALKPVIGEWLRLPE